MGAQGPRLRVRGWRSAPPIKCFWQSGSPSGCSGQSSPSSFLSQHLPHPVPLAIRMSWAYLLCLLPPPLVPLGPPCLLASHSLAGWVSLDSPSLARVNFQRKSSLPRQFYILINPASCGNSPLPQRSLLVLPPEEASVTCVSSLSLTDRPSLPGDVSDGFTQERNAGDALSGV